MDTLDIIDNIKENKIKGGKKKQIKMVERKESDHNKDGQVAHLCTSAYTLTLTLTLTLLAMNHFE